jgi:hypothetical protein
MKEIAGIELKDAGRKPEKPTSVPSMEKTDEPKISYPTMRVEDNGYGSLPLDLENFNAGDKAILVALVSIKEKTKRETQSSESPNDNKVYGEIEFLKVGIEGYKEEKHISGNEAEGKLSKIMSELKDKDE